jgi:hypothetical protein
MRLCDGKIYTMKDIFDKESRIGINRGADQDGFFKKQMCRMRQGFSFAAYVLLDGVKPTDTLCYLGQGKSLFSLTFTETSDEEYEDFLHSIEKRLKKGMVYLLSDSFVTSDIYDQTDFAITDTRDYRAYVVENGKVRKGSILYKVLSAGSIFVPKNCDEFIKRFENKTENVIGYNVIIKGDS